MREPRSCRARHVNAARIDFGGDAPAGPPICGAMVTFITVLLGLAMLGVLGTLFGGMLGLVRSDGNPDRSNRLMRWRVIFQGAALLLFVLLMAMTKH
jgi:hypothetical protein